MTYAYLSPCTLGKIAMLFAFLVFWTRPVHAQDTYDVEIMVKGPWDYVLDPNPKLDPTPVPGDERIVLVAPYDDLHRANFLPSPNASTFYMRNNKDNMVIASS